MSELDLGLVTSVITFICLVGFGFVTGDAITKSEVIGFAGAIAGLIVWYYNEKHNSDLVSGGSNDNDDLVLNVVEEDLINPEYEDLEDEEQV